ncbi:MAG: response regulator [Siphonobacter sp.]
MKLLLIEDEPKTVQSIRQGLEENGFEVDIAYDGLLGKHLAKKNPYDLIVSDIIMPGLNGVELTRELRSEGVETPVLLLTALGGIDEKIMGFDSGADDYLVKPFEFAELLARIRVLTRRWNGSIPIASNILRYTDLEMNLDSKTVIRGDKKIELTAREFSLLEFMLRNQGKVLSKAEIAEKVWDVNFDTGTNVIEVYINLLRKKVDKDFNVRLIHTQYGMGYVLKTED